MPPPPTKAAPGQSVIYKPTSPPIRQPQPQPPAGYDPGQITRPDLAQAIGGNPGEWARYHEQQRQEQQRQQVAAQRAADAAEKAAKEKSYTDILAAGQQPAQLDQQTNRYYPRTNPATGKPAPRAFSTGDQPAPGQPGATVEVKRGDTGEMIVDRSKSPKPAVSTDPGDYSVRLGDQRIDPVRGLFHPDAAVVAESAKALRKRKADEVAQQKQDAALALQSPEFDGLTPDAVKTARMAEVKTPEQEAIVAAAAKRDALQEKTRTLTAEQHRIDRMTPEAWDSEVKALHAKDAETAYREHSAATAARLEAEFQDLVRQGNDLEARRSRWQENNAKGVPDAGFEAHAREGADIADTEKALAALDADIRKRFQAADEWDKRTRETIQWDKARRAEMDQFARPAGGSANTATPGAGAAEAPPLPALGDTGKPGGSSPGDTVTISNVGPEDFPPTALGRRVVPANTVDGRDRAYKVPDIHLARLPEILSSPKFAGADIFLERETGRKDVTLARLQNGTDRLIGAAAAAQHAGHKTEVDPRKVRDIGAKMADDAIKRAIGLSDKITKDIEDYQAIRAPYSDGTEAQARADIEDGVRMANEAHAKEHEQLLSDLQTLRELALDGAVPVNRYMDAWRAAGLDPRPTPEVNKIVDAAGSRNAQDPDTQQKRMDALTSYIENYRGTALFDEAEVAKLYEQQGQKLTREKLRAEGFWSNFGREAKNMVQSTWAGLIRRRVAWNVMTGDMAEAADLEKAAREYDKSVAQRGSIGTDDPFGQGISTGSDWLAFARNSAIQVLPSAAETYALGGIGRLAGAALGNSARVFQGLGIAKVAAEQGGNAAKAIAAVRAGIAAEAAAGTASAAGSMTSKVIAAAGQRMADWGMKAGIAAASYGGNTTEYLSSAYAKMTPEDFVNNPDKVQKATLVSMIAGVPAAALDLLDGVEFSAAKRILGEGAKEVKQTLTKAAAKAIGSLGMDMAKEAATGFGQSVIGVMAARYIDGKPLDAPLSSDELKDIGEGTLGEMVGGGVMHVGSGAIAKVQGAYQAWKAGRQADSAKRVADDVVGRSAETWAGEIGADPAHVAAGFDIIGTPVDADAPSQAALSAAQAEFDTATGGGDQRTAIAMRGVMTAIHTARKQRAEAHAQRAATIGQELSTASPTVQALAKVAAGTPVDQLTDSELSSVGMERGDSGKARQIRDVPALIGITTDGRAIVTDAGKAAVDAEAPTFGATITPESEARKPMEAPSSTGATGSSGTPGTPGASAPATPAATPAAPAAAKPAGKTVREQRDALDAEFSAKWGLAPLPDDPRHAEYTAALAEHRAALAAIGKTSAPAPAATPPAPAGKPSEAPSANLAPRSTETVSPRPARAGRDTTARDEWDEKYGIMKKGGRTHNDDGTPYQPTVFDEIAQTIRSKAQGLSDDAHDSFMQNAVGTSSEYKFEVWLRELIDAGWTWNEDLGRMQDPENPSLTPGRFTNASPASASSTPPTSTPPAPKEWAVTVKGSPDPVIVTAPTKKAAEDSVRRKGRTVTGSKQVKQDKPSDTETAPKSAAPKANIWQRWKAEKDKLDQEYEDTELGSVERAAARKRRKEFEDTVKEPMNPDDPLSSVVVFPNSDSGFGQSLPKGLNGVKFSGHEEDGPTGKRLAIIDSNGDHIGWVDDSKLRPEQRALLKPSPAGGSKSGDQKDNQADKPKDPTSPPKEAAQHYRDAVAQLGTVSDTEKRILAAFFNAGGKALPAFDGVFPAIRWTREKTGSAGFKITNENGAQTLVISLPDMARHMAKAESAAEWGLAALVEEAIHVVQLRLESAGAIKSDEVARLLKAASPDAYKAMLEAYGDAKGNEAFEIMRMVAQKRLTITAGGITVKGVATEETYRIESVTALTRFGRALADIFRELRNVLASIFTDAPPKVQDALNGYVDALETELKALMAAVPAAEKSPASGDQSKGEADAGVATPAGGSSPAVGSSLPQSDTNPPSVNTDGTVDTPAHDAATSPKNDTPQPTDAQKAAGNYKMGHVVVGGMPVTIENPAGSVRSGKDKDGETWQVTMASHYGYVPGTKGKDGDHIDIFIQEGTPLDYSGPVFVVNQMNAAGEFDEHKAVMGPGITTAAAAKAEYLRNYSPGWKGAGTIAKFESVDAFRKWATERRRIAPAPAPRQSDRERPATSPATEVAGQSGQSEPGNTDSAASPATSPATSVAGPKLTPAQERVKALLERARAIKEGEVRSSSVDQSGFMETLPKELRAEMRDAVDSMYEDGMTTPAGLAEFLAGIGFREYSQSLWSSLLANMPENEDSRPDWSAIYSALDNPADSGNTGANESELDQRPESPQAGDAPEPGGSTEPSGSGDSGRMDGNGTNTDAPVGSGRKSDRSASGGGRGSRRRSGGSPSEGNDAPEPQGDSGNERDRNSPDTGLAAINYRIRPNDRLGSGSLKQKYADNIAAIKLVKALEAEGRLATQEEKAVLVRYVGWGGIKGVFNPENKEWGDQHRELVGLLTESEYAAAKRSMLDAHYTSETVITRGIWAAMQRFGFRGGKMYEGGVGIGHFIGLMPDSIRSHTYYIGVEKDTMTAVIAKHLYPESKIWNMGFEDANLSVLSADGVVGNPPFGQQQLYDRNFKHLSKFSIHNYFIAKHIELIRPGGVAAFVVSHNFLDALDPSAREYIGEQAEFLGAIRLPNTAFKGNANTEVVTDLVFFKKRAEPSSNPGEWTRSTRNRDESTGAEYFLNQWISANPSMVLGTPAMTGSMHKEHEYTVEPFAGKELGALLDKAVSELPAGVYEHVDRKTEERLTTPINPEDFGEAKVGGYVVGKDGEIYRRAPDVDMEPRFESAGITSDTTKDRMRGMIAIRDAMNVLVKMEMGGTATDAQMDAARKRLNEIYDAFVKKHGQLNRQANRRAFYNDPQSARILGLERDFDPGISKAVAKKNGVQSREPSATKADIFSRRTNVPYTEITKADTAVEALAVSLNQRGMVSVEYMAELTGFDPARIIGDLKGLIFRLPEGGFEMKDLYLSGNVRAKLNLAKAAAELDSSFNENVEALERVQPEPLTPDQVIATLGAGWIPADVYADFAESLVGERPSSVTYMKHNGGWAFRLESDSLEATQTWGVPPTASSNSEDGSPGKPFGEIMNAIMNVKPVTVYITVDKKRVVHQSATAAAAEKAEAIKDKWNQWVFADEARRDKLVTAYNEAVNNYAPAVFDGSHLTFPGKSPLIQLRRHQGDVAWRIMTQGSTLLDHVVGAGKTFAGVAAFGEMRRVGRVRKPLFVVPNHLVTQWRDDFVRFYPNANILYARPSDFAKDKRKVLFAKILTGEYDAIIIGHSSLIKIAMDPSGTVELLQQMVSEIVETIRALSDDPDNGRVIANLERQQESLQAKMQKLADRGKADDVVTFEELGIDSMFVDEAHEFKNLFYTTQMQRVSGLGNPAGSARAFDLYLKTRVLRKRFGAKAPIVFATGTPLSNSLVEMFTMQRYLQPDVLEDMGATSLDAWAKNFADVKQVYEVDPTGTGYRMSTRFSEFQNVGDLSAAYKVVADVITQADLEKQAKDRGETFPIPKIEGGKPTVFVAKRSKYQEDYFGVETQRVDGDGNGLFDAEGNPIMEYPQGTINWRVDNMPDDPRLDNMLKLTSDARKAGLDMRLINPSLPDVPGSKINIAVEQMLDQYRKWADDRGTQLVFCDLSIPNSAKGKAKAKLEEAKKSLFWIQLGDGTIEALDSKESQAADVEIAAKPSLSFFVFKNAKTGRWMVSERSTGLGIAAGKSRKEAIETADRILLSASADAIEKLLQRVPADEMVADAIEGKNAESADATDENDARDDSTEEISMDELLAEQSPFSVYDDVRDKLIAGGVPAEEIAFIHDFDTPEKKAKLFADVNAGRVRILMGSTPKLGAGTNVQERMVALHHLDAPWRPSDLAQREGRIVRQGNLLYKRDPEGFRVMIGRYGTELTYDTRMWQIIEHKAHGIEGFKRADRTTRRMEDIAGEAANAADMKAATSGNPLIREEIELRGKLEKLLAQQRAWQSNQYTIDRDIRDYEKEPARVAQHRKEIQDWIDTRDRGTPVGFPDNFRITLRDGGTDVEFTEKSGIAKVVANRVSYMNKGDEFMIGKYRGFSITLVRNKSDLDVYLSAPKLTRERVTWFGANDTLSDVGFVQRLDNFLGGLEERKTNQDYRIPRSEKKLEVLREAKKIPFTKADEIEETRRQHTAVRSRLMSSRRATVQPTRTGEGGESSPMPPVTKPDDTLMTPEVVDVLRKSRVQGAFLRLPKDLPRPLYIKVNAALESAGGRWDRYAGAHVFSSDPSEALGIGGDSISSSALPEEAFYSQLERTIEEKMPARASAAQIIGILGEFIVTKTEKVDGKDRTTTVGRFRANQKAEAEAMAKATEGGVAAWQSQARVKEDELKWTGLIPWAEAQPQPLTKAAVLDYLRGEGAVRFVEVQSGRESGNSILQKYAGYQLPGGRNYREFVLAMPLKRALLPGWFWKQSEPEQRNALIREWGLFNERGNVLAWADSKQEALEKTWAFLEKNPKDIGGNDRTGGYTSSHFTGVPNYVAHTRLNEREDATGAPGLFIEEIQSDRHQAGREKGYKEPAEVSVQFEYGNWTVRQNGGIVREFGTEEEANNAAKKFALTQGITDAPFRTTWPLQMFKRALRDAVAAGKKWIGWTTGATQVERFDLSKQIDRVLYTKDEKLIAYAVRTGDTVVNETVPPEKLVDYIGKEAAEKLLAQPAGLNGERVLANADLKVGGKGMIGFYDNILPKEVQKYVRQWGGKVAKGNVAVQNTDSPRTWEVTPEGARFGLRRISTGEIYRDETGMAPYFDKRNDATLKAGELNRAAREIIQTPIWRVDITPDMEAGVKAGQSLFSSEIPEDDALEAEISAMLDAVDGRGGVPRLALSMMSPADKAVDEAYVRDMDEQSVKQWNQEADSIEAALGKDEAFKMLAKKGSRNEILTPAETVLMKRYVVETGRKLRTAADRERAFAIRFAYRNTGGEVARAMRARVDEFMTPSERLHAFLTGMLFEPSDAAKRAAAKKRKQAEEAEPKEADKLRAEAEKIETEDVRKMVAKLESDLKKSGFTIDEWLNTNVRIEADAPVFVRLMRTMDQWKQSALRRMQGGDVPFRKIAKELRKSEGEVAAVRTEFEKKFREWALSQIKPGMTADELIGLMKGEAIMSGALPDDMSPADKERLIQEALRKMGLVNPAHQGKAKVAVRRNGKRAPLDPGTIARMTINRWKNPNARERSAVADAVKEYAKKNDASEEARDALREKLIGIGVTKETAVEMSKMAHERLLASRLGEKEKFVTFIDTDDAESTVIAAKAMSAARGDVLDMVREYWYFSVLSGPKTQVVNAASYPLHMVFNQGITRGLSALLNSAFSAVGLGNAMGPKLGELGIMWRAAVSNLAGERGGLADAWRLAMMSYRTGIDFLAFDKVHDKMVTSKKDVDDMMTALKKMGMEVPQAAIPGLVGKVIRSPMTGMQFIDVFGKTVIAHMEAAAWALRIARAEVKGQSFPSKAARLAAIEGRVTELLNETGSRAWREAINDATEAGFQTPLDGGRVPTNAVDSVERAVAGVIAKIDNALARKGRGKVGFVGDAVRVMVKLLLMPFTKTPYNIVRIGLRKTPLGTLGFVARTIEAGMMHMAGKRGFSAVYGRFFEHLAEQILAWGAAAFLFGLAEGGGDDDDKSVITGGPLPGRGDRAENAARMARYGGDYVLRIGNRETGIKIPYGRYEPIATVMGTTIDMIRAAKMDKDTTAVERINRVMAGLAGQMSQKTFLKGLSDAATAVSDVTGGSGERARQYGLGLLATLVPNVIKAPIRDSDDYMREWRTASDWYQFVPAWSNAQVKVVPGTGESVKKEGAVGARWFVPTAADTSSKLPPYMTAVVNYNAGRGGQPFDKGGTWAPDMPDQKLEGHPSLPKGSVIELTPEVYTWAIRQAAGIAASSISLSPAEVKSPSRETIERIRDAWGKANRQVRDTLRSKPPAKIGTVQ